MNNLIIRLLALPLILLITGCFHSTAMSRDVYDGIAVGMPIADVEAQAGQPGIFVPKGAMFKSTNTSNV